MRSKYIYIYIYSAFNKNRIKIEKIVAHGMDKN